MNYDLPTKLEISGRQYNIRYDFRPILDICAAVDDPELDQQEKAIAALEIFYPDLEEIHPMDYEEALQKCFWFVNGGEEERKRGGPKLVSWEKDMKYIIAPINRVMKQEIRAIPYDMETNTGGLHWWSFLSAYMEIGDCTFAQIVRIRNLKARGKKMDQSDREWYRQNRDLVDFERVYTEEENDLMKELTGVK